jgi:ubiquinone/menaquinone biosynthesis C-methylase UbiE
MLPEKNGGSTFSGSFSNIDSARDPAEYVRFMDDANAMEFFRTAKEHTYALLALEAGNHVLDVGCGTGDDVRALAQIVGPTGLAVGIDSSLTMIGAARLRADSHAGVEFRVGNAQRLDFADATFDACRTDRVLQHLSDPGQAVDEIVRVLRPGGRLVAFEPDTGGLLLDAPDQAVTRKILNFRSDAVRSGWIGRQLPRLFKTAALTNVEALVLPSPRSDYAHTNASLRLDYYAQCAADAEVISHAEAARWSESLAAWAADGFFFCLVTMLVVVGRKP